MKHTQATTKGPETHRCPGPGLAGGRAVVRRRRSSFLVVCAWRRRPASGRCGEAAGGTRAAPSPSPPARRRRPSWSAGSPDRPAAGGGNGSRGHVSVGRLRCYSNRWERGKRPPSERRATRTTSARGALMSLCNFAPISADQILYDEAESLNATRPHAQKPARVSIPPTTLPRGLLRVPLRGPSSP